MLPFYRSACLLFLLLPGLAAADPEILEDRATTLVYPPFFHTPLGLHRGTPELLALFVGSRTHFDHPQGLACAPLFSEINALDPGPDFQLTVIGANTGQKHLLYNPSLNGLEVVGDRGHTLGLFQRPLGVAASVSGTVYVTDPDARAVVRLQWQNHGLTPAGFLNAPAAGWRAPWGIALNSQGEIYVTDAETNCIHIFSSSGSLLQTLGPAIADNIILNSPEALAVADNNEFWSYYKEDAIFVVDRQGARLLRLDPQGKIQYRLELNKLQGCGRPVRLAWLALDYYSNVWATDPANHCIHKFNRHLQYLASYGAFGKGDGLFQEPRGIAIHRHFGQVFVGEAQGAHYFWIGADVLNPRAEKDNNSGRVRTWFTLTEPAWFTVVLKNRSGQEEQTLMKKNWLDSGLQTLDFLPVAALAGKPLTLMLTAEATYSSATFFAKRIKINLE